MVDELPPVLLRCCCVLHDGLGTTGVSPVPPSIRESKLNPGIPDEGVVIAIPAISCQLFEDRGGAFVKGEATGSDVGRGRGAVVGLVNSTKPSDEDSSLSCLSFLMGCCCVCRCCCCCCSWPFGIGIKLGMAGRTGALLFGT